MKLISKFRDYYDIGLSVGIDERIRYIRHTNEIKIPNIEQIEAFKPLVDFLNLTPSVGFTDKLGKGTKCQIEEVDYPMFLFFCGKVYPMINMQISASERLLVQLGYKEPYDNIYTEQSRKNLGLFYSIQAIRDELMKFNVDYDLDIRDTRFGNKMSALFDTKIPSKLIDDVHFHFDSPIILISHADIWATSALRSYCDSHQRKMATLNPCLLDLNFQSVIDPYTAFQELQMYISGVMGGESPKTIEIADKDKIAKKGFDAKMGFRNRGNTRNRR